MGGILLLLSLGQMGMASVPATSTSGQKTGNLQERVLHALRMLPYDGVFSEIRYNIDNETVTLEGDVQWPILKSDAENAVARVDGVKKVVNDIEVLPLSSADDSLRLRMYWAIYSQPGFEKYAVQATKPIRIIVKNGNVTLIGVVGSELDKTLAGTAARNVPFAFSVTNDLTVG